MSKCKVVVGQWISSILLLGLSLSQPLLAAGVDWLESQGQVDGSYVSQAAIASPYQATAEVLSTYSKLESAQASITTALSYLNADTYNSTEHLARKIMANAQQGNDVTSFVTELLSRQNDDGGYGEFHGYDSTVLDTAIAIQALAIGNANNDEVLRTTLGWLVDEQNVDGSFAFNDSATSPVFITAQVILALEFYRFTYDVSPVINSASDYLYSTQQLDGSWGSEWETAVALMAIIGTPTDTNAISKAVEFLNTQQLPDFSWSNDTYITALALRALSTASIINLPVQPTLGSVNGVFIDATTSQPLSGVSLNDQQGAVLGQSNAHGQLTINNLAAGQHVLTISKQGYQTITINLSVAEGGVVNLGTISLNPDLTTGVIAGVITDASTGATIAGATVTITGTTTTTLQTNTDGTFGTSLSPEVITITVSAAGYDPVSATAAIALGSVLTFSPSLVPTDPNTQPADPSVILQGRVIDSSNGAPVAGAQINLIGTTLTAISGTNGAFVINGITAGSHQVQVSAGGYLTATYNIVASEGSTLNLGDINLIKQTDTGITILQGSVVDSATQSPVAGVTISVPEMNVSVVTDTTGNYFIDNINLTQFTVNTSSVGYQDKSLSVGITQSGIMNLDIAIDKTIASGVSITSITAPASSFPALTEIYMDVNLENTGLTSKDVRLFFKVVNTAGEIVEHVPTMVVPLNGDPAAAIKTVPANGSFLDKVEWDTKRHTPGDYNIIIQAFDASTNQLLAERALPITIEVTNKLGGGVSFDPPITQLASNQPVAINARLANRGNMPIDATSITATVRMKNQGYQVRKDTVDGQVVADGAQGLSAPSGMAKDAAGNIYIANNVAGGTISRVTPTGEVSEFANGFVFPVDVAFDVAGNLLVLEKGRHLTVIDQTGQKTTIVTNIDNQKAIEVTSSGRILIAAVKSVHELLPDGTVQQLVGGGLANPSSIAINSLGEFFIASTSDNAIMKFANGQLTTFATNIQSPLGVAVDAVNNVYVINTNTLYRIQTDGTVSVLSTGLNGAFDIKIALDGNIVVSNTFANTIVKIDPITGQQSILAQKSVYGPIAAEYDTAGQLHVLNNQGMDITRFDISGNVLGRTGIGASGLVDFTIDNIGDYLVLEQYGNRLTKVTQDSTRTILANPNGAKALLASPDGNGVLIAEQNKVVRLDNANVMSTYVSAQLNQPVASRFYNGELYVLNQDGTVYKIAQDTSTTLIASIPTRTAHGLAINQQTGDIYVGDYVNRQIYQVDALGVMTSIATLTFNPGALAVRPDGTLLVAQWGGRDINAMQPDGSLSVIATLQYPIYNDIQADANYIWAVHSSHHRVSRVSADGLTQQSFYLLQPRSILLDTQGGAYIGNRTGVDYIDATGAISDYVNVDGTTTLAAGVAIDANQNTWVVTTNNELYLFDATKQLINKFGAPKNIRGIAEDNGNIYILTSNAILEMHDPAKLARIVVAGAYTKISSGSTPGQLILATGNSVKILDLSTSTISNVTSNASTIGFALAQPTSGYIISSSVDNELIYLATDGTEVARHVGLISPKGLWVNNAGELYVVNSYPPSIAKVSTDGKLTTQFKSQNLNYITQNAAGNFVASLSPNSLREFTPRGTIINAIAVPGSRGLVFDANGELYVLSNTIGELLKIQGDNTISLVATGMGSTGDIIEYAGKILVADSAKNVINELNQNNSLSLYEENISQPGMMHKSGDGKLYVSYGGFRIAIYDDAKNRIEVPTNIVEAPIGGLLFGDDNNLYVTSQRVHMLVKLLISKQGIDVLPGQTVYSVTKNISRLELDALPLKLSLGQWVPEASGDYEVVLAINTPGVQSDLNNTIHVGAKAEGQFTFVQNNVLPGDRELSGELRIVGADSSTITRIDPDSTALSAISNANGRAIAADSFGNIYAADITRIVKVSPDGNVSDFVTNIRVGNGLVVDRDDNIYAYYQNAVLKITPQGQVNTIATMPGNVGAVAVGNNNQIYVVDHSNALTELHPDGSKTVITTLGLSTPRALTIDAYDNFYVLNNPMPGRLVSSINKISPDGKNVSTFYDKAGFEFEGVNVTADCSNNVLFAPFFMEGIWPSTREENEIWQVVGDTGEARKVLEGGTIDAALRDMDVLFYDRPGNRLLIWTDLNNGKIFSFPVICGGINLDAHIITRGDVDLSATNPAPDSVVNHPDGTKEYIWSLVDVDAKGFSIQLNTLLKGMAEGEQRPLFKDAFLLFNNSFATNQDVRVPIAIPSIAADSAIAITSSTNATDYGPDSMVGITTNVANNNAQEFTGTLHTEVQDINGVVVATLPTINVSVLANSASVYNGQWSVGSTLAGQYKVVSTVQDTAGVSVDTTESLFNIVSSTLPGSTVLTSGLYTDKQAYQSWDDILLFGRVRNTTTNTIQLPTMARLSVSDPTGNVVYSSTLNVGQLFPGGYRDLPGQLSISDAVAGSYTATLVISDTATGAQLSLSQSSFLVERIASQGVIGNVKVSNRVVEAGTNTTCTETVSNISSTALTAVTIEHQLVSLDTGTVVSTSSQVSDMAGNGVVSNPVEINTSNLTPGEYGCLLSANISGAAKQLAMAGFQVTEPAVVVDLDATMQLGARGRLLVLITDPYAVVQDDGYHHDDEHDGYHHDDEYYHDGDHDSYSSTSITTYTGPTLTEQVAYLDTLLTQQGWGYTITTNVNDFITHMHSGQYMNYALLGEQIHLGDHAQGLHHEELEYELTEAVNRGEGVLVATRMDDIDDALGVDDDEMAYSTGILFAPSDLHPGGLLNFTGSTLVQAVEVEEAQSVGILQNLTLAEGEEHLPEDNVGATVHTYGNGKSVYLGFNVVNQAMLAGTDNGFETLLANALTFIQSSPINLLSGSVIPIGVNVTNPSVTTDGRIIMALPTGSHVMDVAGATYNLANHSLMYNFNITEGGSVNWQPEIQLPAGMTNAAFYVDVQSGVEPNTVSQEQLLLEMPITVTPILSDIITALEAYRFADEDFNEAYNYLLVANNKLVINDLLGAHLDLIEAAEELDESLNPAIQQIRLDIDYLIRDITMQLQ